VSAIDPSTVWETWWRALGLRAPLSGDVAQAIETSLVRSLGEQFGLINISTTRAGDPELERRITQEVASYGRQLGTVLDAVDALIRHQRGETLPPDDERALDVLQELRAQVEELKAHNATESAERVIDEVERLARRPQENAATLRRLRAALDTG
jgi:hypothetical protein